MVQYDEGLHFYFLSLSCKHYDNNNLNYEFIFRHFASAFGPVLAVWFFSQRLSNEFKGIGDADMSRYPQFLTFLPLEPVMGCHYYFDSFGLLPVVPTFAVAFGATVNICANFMGAAPLD